MNDTHKEMLVSIRRLILKKIDEVERSYADSNRFVPQSLNLNGYKIEQLYQDGKSIEECLTAFEGLAQEILRAAEGLEAGPDAESHYKKGLGARLHAEAQAIQADINMKRQELLAQPVEGEKTEQAGNCCPVRA